MTRYKRNFTMRSIPLGAPELLGSLLVEYFHGSLGRDLLFNDSHKPNTPQKIKTWTTRALEHFKKCSSSSSFLLPSSLMMTRYKRNFLQCVPFHSGLQSF
ncbi:hypothetical protein CEXT_517091 [Caerostris extrusa]|uniref:Uncharacterized protein n=1 Tax=Caerostris extrusa TaxID=172846 RepID=A0AAV4XD70_CAEEX|nr:hypothetical protein CEXT_517091 [Caerostris extrusa]